MTNFSGRKVAIGLAKEATRGTAVTPSYWLGWMSTDLDDLGKTQLNESAINVLDKNVGAEIVELTGGGKIDGLITDQSFGLILYSLLGSHSVALHSTETLVYDHTFTESQLNDSQSLTLTRKDPNVDQQFALAMIKSLELDIVAGDYVKMTSDWVTQPSATGTDTTAFVQENHFTAKMASLKLASNISGLTSATAVLAKDVKLTIDKGVNPYFIIGQNNPTDIFAQEMTVKGDFTLLYTDDTYKTLRFNNTPQAVQIVLENSGVTIGTASHPTITFTLPQVFLTEWKPAQPVDGMVEQTITFEGTFSLASAYMIQAVLTNLVTTY